MYHGFSKATTLKLDICGRKGPHVCMSPCFFPQIQNKDVHWQIERKIYTAVYDELNRFLPQYNEAKWNPIKMHWFQMDGSSQTDLNKKKKQFLFYLDSKKNTSSNRKSIGMCSQQSGLV